MRRLDLLPVELLSDVIERHPFREEPLDPRAPAVIVPVAANVRQWDVVRRSELTTG